jgi:hypothetical protein
MLGLRQSTLLGLNIVSEQAASDIAFAPRRISRPRWDRFSQSASSRLRTLGAACARPTARMEKRPKCECDCSTLDRACRYDSATKPR